MSTIDAILARRHLQLGTIAFRHIHERHVATYVIAVLGCVHHTLLVKAGVRQPLAFGAR